jgi:quercetin dioxygenase-like cupin family protein
MVLSKQDIEHKYQALGLETRCLVDKPGLVYEPHRHAAVYLYTLKGSAKLKLDNKKWQQVKPGQEIVIHDDQLHEAIVGAGGWEYVFATSPKEMKRQGL